MQEKLSRAQNALLRLTLPLPPSINEQYATVNGHRVSSAVARRFKQQVHSVLRTLERQGLVHEDLCHSLRQNYLALFLDFYFSTPLLLKHIDPLHPHLDVELEAIPEWQFDKEYIVLS